MHHALQASHCIARPAAASVTICGRPSAANAAFEKLWCVGHGEETRGEGGNRDGCGMWGMGRHTRV